MRTTTVRMSHWCLGWGLVIAFVSLGTVAPVAAEMPRVVYYDLAAAVAPVAVASVPATTPAESDATSMEAPAASIELRLSPISVHLSELLTP